MGTLLLTLNKWEIMSEDLWGHYMACQKPPAISHNLNATYKQINN
ncbi:hypothetical protein SAMN05216328_15122 [Ensifer sp. YR511]|nr:hypothetical protein SAMN05216328_15122 [Ensifer sp. YR511]